MEAYLVAPEAAVWTDMNSNSLLPSYPFTPLFCPVFLAPAARPFPDDFAVVVYTTRLPRSPPLTPPLATFAFLSCDIKLGSTTW